MSARGRADPGLIESRHGDSALCARLSAEGNALAARGRYDALRPLIESVRVEAHEMGDLLAECGAFNARAALDRFEHRNDIAIARATLVLFLLRTAGGDDAAAARSQAWSNIAAAQFQLGRIAQSRGACAWAFREGRHLRSSDVRGDIETMGIAYSNLAAIRQLRGRYDGAERAFIKVERAMTRLYGELHFQVAFLRALRAGLRMIKGELLAALSLASDAASILSECGATEHPVAAVVLTQRSSIKYCMDDLNGASEDIRASIRVMSSSTLDSPAWRAGVHSAASKILAEQGDHEDALVHAHAALRMEIQASGDRTIEVASAWVDLGIVAMHAKRYEDARGAFDWAVREFERLQARGHTMYPFACLNLAIWVAVDDPDRAMSLMLRGLDARRRSCGASSDQFRSDLAFALDILESHGLDDHALTLDVAFPVR